MKIAPKSAREFLQKPDKNTVGVLFYGPDAGLVRERMQQVAAVILGKDGDPFGRMELGEDQLKNDPARLSDELCAMSLLGGRRVILVRDVGDKATKAVEGALERADGSNYLVVCADELGPRSSLRQLFEGHDKLAALACYKDEAVDLQTVIRQRLETAGIHCAREAFTYLTQHLGNDRYVTYSELDKVILYLGDEKQLSLEVAQELVGHNKEVQLDGAGHG
jgi:DNA polymerase III subunit delta